MYPVLVRLGPVDIATHDAFTVAAIVVGLALYYAELRRRGWLDARIVWISLAAVFGAGVGARLITLWERPEVVAAAASMPLSMAIEHSGKSIIGAIAGGYVAIVVAKRAFGYTRSTGDAYALAIPVATIVGRIGCFLTELPLGTPTSLPWGMRVSPGAAAAFPVCPGCGGPMHPSMLYEIAFNIVAALVIVRWRRRVPVAGDTLKLYLLAAGIFRFLVEFVRANPPQALGLTGPQWVLIPLVGLLVLHFIRQRRRDAYRVPSPPTSHACPRRRTGGPPVTGSGGQRPRPERHAGPGPGAARRRGRPAQGAGKPLPNARRRGIAQEQGARPLFRELGARAVRDRHRAHEGRHRPPVPRPSPGSSSWPRHVLAFEVTGSDLGSRTSGVGTGISGGYPAAGWRGQFLSCSLAAGKSVSRTSVGGR